MAPYHIGKNGEPRVCNAKIKCRLGDESAHWNSKEEALKAVLAQAIETHGQSLPQPKRKRQPKTLAEARSFLGVPTEEKMERLILKQLRKQYTRKEIETMMEAGLDHVEYYVYFAGNREVTLDKDSRASQRTFTYGACGYLAYNLHRTTGLQLALFTETDGKGQEVEHWRGHAAVKLPNGEFLDIHGRSPRSSVLNHFGLNHTWAYSEPYLPTFLNRMKVSEDSILGDLGELEKATLAKFTLDILEEEGLLSD